MLNLFQTFAQDTLSDPVLYNYPTETTESSVNGFVVLAAILVGLAVTVFLLAAMWRVYTKAGRAGWKAIVPIYNYWVLLQIVGRPTWWIVFMVIGVFSSLNPLLGFVLFVVSTVVTVIVSHDLSKSFGRGTGMTVLLVLLPFIGYPMLAWGDATYQGPAALPKAAKNDGHSTTTPPATPQV